MRYNSRLEILETREYVRWFGRLRNKRARARILSRVRHLAMGHAGDCRAVGEGVRELRIDHGPGYRVYFVQRGKLLVILLAGGDKHTQVRDIERALTLARNV